MEQLKDEFISTEDRILLAAIDLMEKKGFKAVTTREIAAQAGFSEMTLFRHFGTKKRLLEDAVNRYSYILDMEQILLNNVQFDLEKDLMMVCNLYHKYMERNQKIVLLAFQERNTNPDIAEKVAENPKVLKQYLMRYFEEMQCRGEIIQGDVEALAMQFLWLNLGFFIAQFIGGKRVSTISVDEFMQESVKVFVRGIKVEKLISI